MTAAASALAGLVGLRPAVVVSVGLVATAYGWLSPLRTIDRQGPTSASDPSGQPSSGEVVPEEAAR